VSEVVEANVGEEAFRSLTPKSTTCDNYPRMVLTPPLTPLRALHAESPSNHQQTKRLI
jgi:hypothetical protein